MKLQIDLVSTPSTIEQRSVHKKKKKWNVQKNYPRALTNHDRRSYQ